MSEPVKIAEDLRDLYALTKRNTMGSINNPRVQKLIERLSAAEAALALLRETLAMVTQCTACPLCKHRAIDALAGGASKCNSQSTQQKESK